MASPLSADLLTAVEDWATEFCMTVLKGVAMEMQVDGHVVGDVELDRQQRINAFESMVRSGEMNSLVVVNLQYAQDLTEQYERDILKTPPYTGKV